MRKKAQGSHDHRHGEGSSEPTGEHRALGQGMHLSPPHLSGVVTASTIVPGGPDPAGTHVGTGQQPAH